MIVSNTLLSSSIQVPWKFGILGGRVTGWKLFVQCRHLSQCAKPEVLHQVTHLKCLPPISASFIGTFDAVALEVAQVYARTLMQQYATVGAQVFDGLWGRMVWVHMLLF